MGVLSEIIYNLLQFVAGLIGGMLLLRFWMQAIRVRPPNSFGGFVFAVTDWLVKPLRRVIPGVGGYDWASLLGAFLIGMLFASAVGLLFGSLTIKAVLVGALAVVVNWTYYGLVVIVLLQVAMSWINPHAPQAPFINALTAPLLRPIRRIVPPIGNVDISPMIMMFVIYVLWRVVMQLITYI
jgi:YggT family protein